MRREPNRQGRQRKAKVKLAHVRHPAAHITLRKADPATGTNQLPIGDVVITADFEKAAVDLHARRAEAINDARIDVIADEIMLHHVRHPRWKTAPRDIAFSGITREWDIPFPSHPFTLDQLREILVARLGQKMRISAFPWWLMVAIAPLSELIREFRKMRYLFATSHQLGDAKFKRLLPEFQWTALETVLLSGLPADVHPNEPVRTSGKPIAAE